MEIKTILEEFDVIAKDPVTYLRNLSENGKKIVLYTCSYVPDEIIWAFGFHPARVLGISETHQLSNSHLQPYCCPTAKAVLEDILSKKLPAAHVVFSNTCDTMQRVSDIVRINTDLEHFDFMVPTRLDSDTSKKYLREQILNLAGFLKRRSLLLEQDRECFDDVYMINSAMKLFERIYRSVLKLAEISQISNKISNKDMHNIFIASAIMDREDLAKKIEQLNDCIKESTISNSVKKKIVLTGSLCCFPGIYEILDNAGAKVVYDDLCSGIRPYKRRIKLTGDWAYDIAKSLLERPICAAKFKGLFERILYLKDIVKKYRAQGIIFLVPKFCDPHLFDYPDIKKEMDVPVLLLETDEKNQIKGPEKTRIEAFLETI